LRQKHHKPYLGVVLLVSILLGSALGVVTALTSLKELKSITLNAFSCATGNERLSESFDFIVTNKFVGVSLATQLCQNPSVQKQFGAVTARWRQKESREIMSLMQGQPYLVSFPQDLMEALPSTEAHAYQKLAFYPSYLSYFIARDHIPAVDKAYFIGKRVGLIKSSKSESGYIAPIELFNTLGLERDQINIRYAASHSQLREAIQRGELDVIASYWSPDDAAWTEAAFASSYGKPVRGYGWYIKKGHENRSLMCAVLQEILTLADNTTDDYFSQITSTDACAGALK